MKQKEMSSFSTMFGWEIEIFSGYLNVLTSAKFLLLVPVERESIMT